MAAWREVGRSLVGAGRGVVVRHRPMLVGTTAERMPPYGAAPRALPRALSAHCPAPPRWAVGGAGGDPWHAVGSARSVRNSVRGMSGDTGRTEDATETHFGFQTVRSDQKAKLVGARTSRCRVRDLRFTF